LSERSERREWLWAQSEDFFAIFATRARLLPVMAKQILKLGDITLRWSKWTPWNDLKADARKDGDAVPGGVSGVYEVGRIGSTERMTVGKASDLRRRIVRALILGKTPHSAGKRIRANERTTTLVVRWAKTERPAAAEEELHRLYQRKHGRLPKYTKLT